MFDSRTSRELRILAEGTTGEEFKEKVLAMLEEDNDAKILNIFQELGITEDVVGVKETWEAIIFCLNDEGAKHQIPNFLYPALAKMFGVKSDDIRKRICQAIEVAYKKPETREAFKKYCQGIGKPTNEKFIKGVVAWILHNI